jgi:hypothetical protein
VSIVDSEKKRSDEYWMGVRDALRMVDSFTKWARRNERRAKSLDDFIHDGLVAAAKRCESCLKEDLGLTFAEDKMEKDISSDIERVPPGYRIDESSRDDAEFEEIPEPEFEVFPEDESPEESEVKIESEDEMVSIDAVGRLEEEEMEDISIDGPTREFSSDFELVEPTDLLVEQPEFETEAEEKSDIESTIEDELSDESEHRPSFTWADYEKAVSPAEDDSEMIDDIEETEFTPFAPIEDESLTPDEIEPTSETISIPEPPDIPIDDFESSSDEEEETGDESKPITEPPPPPPPPDSDEDEEERRRRARRLFFGD